MHIGLLLFSDGDTKTFRQGFFMKTIYNSVGKVRKAQETPMKRQTMR